MAAISALDDYRSRAAVTLAVAAAHVALIIVILRSVGHSTEDVVDITFFALPINPEDRPRAPARTQKELVSQAANAAARHTSTARKSATEQPVEPASPTKPSQSETDARHDTFAAPAGAATNRAPPVDWRAEIETTARALEQHDRIERGRRSLAGPNRPALKASAGKPACPYEECEPGWGENLGIFSSSLHSKAGRIESIPNDIPTTSNGSLNVTGRDVIRWTSNWCYVILVSQDPSRRGTSRCSVPLGKTPARGDLFDHMNEGQLPKSHDTEAPWISYKLSIGASHTDPRADR